jgi:ribosomal protein S27E
MLPNLEKLESDNRPATIKCPKCGHEFKCEPGWLKASAMIGCPKCAALIRVRKPETG